jgi:hypothetical protein
MSLQQFKMFLMSVNGENNTKNADINGMTA